MIAAAAKQSGAQLWLRPEWTLLAFLWVCYVLNHADRQVVYSLFPALQRQFGYSDTVLGLTGRPVLMGLRILLAGCGCPRGSIFKDEADRWQPCGLEYPNGTLRGFSQWRFPARLPCLAGSFGIIIHACGVRADGQCARSRDSFQGGRNLCYEPTRRSCRRRIG